MNTSVSFPEPNAFTEPLFRKLRKHPKRIVFTEGEDVRVVRAAGEMARLELGVPVLIGKEKGIRELLRQEGVDRDFVMVIEPEHADDFDLFVERFERISRLRGKKLANAREVVAKRAVFGGMMIQYGQADALVGGNELEPGVLFRALRQSVKPLPKLAGMFSVVVAVAGDGCMRNLGRNGYVFLADCGFYPRPEPRELADIATRTGALATHHVGRRPRVVMLSHSTRGSNRNTESERVVSALALARQEAGAEEIDLDGELQLDVALDPVAAEVKLRDEAVGRGADALVFPGLDSAHIAMKLLQHVAGARCYGQLIMGLARPTAQLPRTADEEMILGTAAAVGVEAVQFHDLYPEGRGISWA